MVTVEFWKEALWRAFRTFCQTLLSIFGGSALNVWNVGWHNSLGVAVGAAFISLLMSVDRSTAVLKGEPVTPVAQFAPLPAMPPAMPYQPVSAVTPLDHPVPVTTVCGDTLR